MDEVKKMLRAIINGQSALKEELMGEIGKTRGELGKARNELRGDIKRLDVKIDKVESNLTSRMDKIGASVAYLEDDAPTQDEHDKLEKRVTKIERKLQVQAL